MECADADKYDRIYCNALTVINKIVFTSPEAMVEFSGKKKYNLGTRHPHPAPSTFLLSPHFSRGSNAKKLFRTVRFHSARAGTLATQAT